MLRSIFLAILVGFVLATNSLAQGFAGLGTQVDGFAVPERGKPFVFPQDHGAHPEYRIEWWYLTAVLKGEDGTSYGAQWTLFRSALEPRADTGWTTPQLWMGHAAVTTPNAHYHAERLARGGVGVAGTQSGPFSAYIDEWAMTSASSRLRDGDDALSALDVSARGEGFSYELNLDATGPLVFHGENGFSVKSGQGQASYYYSQPFYEVSGWLELPDGRVEVTGQAWLDREYSSQPLSEDQYGWDWVSFHLETGEKMMGFQLRQTDGEVYTAASWISPEGELTMFEDGALTMEPLEIARVYDRDVPIRWRIQLPARELDVEVRALNPQSWMPTVFSYWEGPIMIEGSHGGNGYLEMTGYEP